MSIFDYEFFFGGDDELAVSKEKYTKEEAIDLAKQQFDLPLENCMRLLRKSSRDN